MSQAGPTCRHHVRPSELVPRLLDQGYRTVDVESRRSWVEAKTQCRLRDVAACSLNPEQFRGNIENPIGSIQMPLGVAGPLRIHGQHARGTYYVPLATTEGALVRSYERGMAILTRSGGVDARVFGQENRVCPSFSFSSLGAAHSFANRLGAVFPELKREAELTTSHGRLLRCDPHPVGRSVIVDFRFDTADAHGMNMIVRATDRACRWLVARTDALRYSLFTGSSSEKRAGGNLFAGGKGRRVVAAARLPESLLRRYLKIGAKELYQVWHDTILGHVHANVVGYNAHYANGLTALFIACGQDVANVVNSSVGITDFALSEENDLEVSVTLPALSVATVGGGTGLGTSAECLAMLGCVGTGKAAKLAEITAATLLAGELSMGAAIGTDQFVQAHETYGRNRPIAPEESA